MRHESDGHRGLPRGFTAGGPWLLGAIVAACVVAQAGGEPASAWLRYERAAVLRGELWRIFSCHFVHLSSVHLALNLAGLALISLIFGRDYAPAAWVGIGAAAMALIGGGLLVLSPQIDWYVGLSGVLHAGLAAGAVSWWRAGPRWLAGALGTGLIGKLVYEQWLGSMSLLATLPVVVDAHLYGAVAGFVAALLYRPPLAAIR